LCHFSGYGPIAGRHSAVISDPLFQKNRNYLACKIGWEGLTNNNWLENAVHFAVSAELARFYGG
jgi:hypothetical protein